MASTTRNVKLGVCQVFLKGLDLGYTKGGVEVSVTTETHEVNVDQYGNTAVNELIMGRDLKVKVPMAETTLENLVAVMPGTTLVATGGSVASGTVSIAANPADGENIVVNGVTFSFETSPLLENDVQLGATAAETAANLAAALNASNDPAVAAATYAVAGTVITVTYGNVAVYGTTGMKSVEGNSFTLSSGTAALDVTMSGATLTGGADPTSKMLVAESGVGLELLSRARELRLHPVDKSAEDMSEDFIVPLAGTAGALSFAYKVDDERVYNVEFTGYPDPATKRLFTVGGR